MGGADVQEPRCTTPFLHNENLAHRRIALTPPGRSPARGTGRVAVADGDAVLPVGREDHVVHHVDRAAEGDVGPGEAAVVAAEDETRIDVPCRLRFATWWGYP